MRTGGFDARLHNHYMRTRIRIGAQASDGSDEQMFNYSIFVFVIMMNCFDGDKMIHLVVTSIVRLRRSKRRRRNE